MNIFVQEAMAQTLQPVSTGSTVAWVMPVLVIGLCIVVVVMWRKMTDSAKEKVVREWKDKLEAAELKLREEIEEAHELIAKQRDLIRKQVLDTKKPEAEPPKVETPKESEPPKFDGILRL